MQFKSTIKKGIISENPVFIQALAMCPVLAVTTTIFNGLGMGLATTFVLLITNILISLSRKAIPQRVRIPCFIVMIAGAVTAVSLLTEAHIPQLHANLGIFLPLIVTNCIVLARGEGFAFKNGPLLSAIDGLAMGIGLTIALVLLSFFRELFGNGTLFDGLLAPEHVITLPYAFPRTLLIILPPGAFITLGIIMATLRHISSKRKDASQIKEVA